MMSREWSRLDEATQSRIQSFQETIPVKLADLGRALGVSIKAATLPPGISGEIRPSDGGYLIRINRHDAAKRQRFTVAHELAHFLLHKDDIGSGIADDVLYRSSMTSLREQEANRLAADLLMPESLVREHKEVAEERGVGDVLLYLAEVFDVSEAAMRIRLG